MLPISSSYNDSLLNPHEDISHCLATNKEKMIFNASNAIHVLLLLPLCVFILRSAFQQLQKKSLSSSASISHCDVFTYHMVVMELIGASGLFVSFSASCVQKVELFSVGLLVFSFTWYGQIFFHILTCVERYLAVVHPITYRCLRNEKGIRIRNICIGCIWMLCFGGSCAVNAGKHIYLDLCFMGLSSVIVSFCSVSVLCALIRPGPGGPGRERADQSKQKAFYTIVVILGILMIRLCLGLVWALFDISGNPAKCMLITCLVYTNIPSSLVLPLLFLQRRGKLQCCKSI